MKLLYFSLIAVFGLQMTKAQIALQSFEPTSGYSGKEFGSQVAVGANDILAATISTDTAPGKVYLFNTSLEQLQIFYPDDAAIDDAFGSSFSIDGDFIAIGSYNHDAGATDAGAVYIYKKNGGNYTLSQKITAADLVPGQRLGRTVLLQDGFLYLTSALQVETEASGAVYIYWFDGSQWIFKQKLTTIGHPIVNGSQIASLNGEVSVSTDNMMVFAYPYVTRFKLVNGDWVYQYASFIGLTMDDSPILHMLYSEGEHFTIAESPFQEYFSIANILPPYQPSVIDIGIPQFIGEDLIYYTKLVAASGKLFIGAVYTPFKSPVFYYQKIGGQWYFQSILYGNAAEQTQDSFGSSMATKANMAVFGARSEGNGKAYFASEATLKNESFSKDQIEVYPNPVNDILKINNQKDEILGAEVYSLTGKLLLSAQDHPNQIDLSRFNSGLYFVKITSANAGEQTFKIVKN